MLYDPTAYPCVEEFQGHYRFLSNFVPCVVELDGKTYPTVEHAYQAAKTHDPALRYEIRKLISPGAAKRITRQMVIRRDWEEVKIGVMRGLLEQKFSQETFDFQLEVLRGFTLIEGNKWGDTFWGCVKVQGYKWQGENNLGKLLMEIRDAKRPLTERAGSTLLRG